MSGGSDFTAKAGEPEVLDVELEAEDDGRYNVAVTVRHGDEGWDHYADRWEILDGEGNVVGIRVLHHPHEHNVPFTRSLSGVRVPAGIEEVTVRAHCSVHGNSDVKAMTVRLPDR